MRPLPKFLRSAQFVSGAVRLVRRQKLRPHVTLPVDSALAPAGVQRLAELNVPDLFQKVRHFVPPARVGAPRRSVAQSLLRRRRPVLIPRLVQVVLVWPQRLHRRVLLRQQRLNRPVCANGVSVKAAGGATVVSINAPGCATGISMKAAGCATGVSFKAAGCFYDFAKYGSF